MFQQKSVLHPIEMCGEIHSLKSLQQLCCLTTHAYPAIAKGILTTDCSIVSKHNVYYS